MGFGLVDLLDLVCCWQGSILECLELSLGFGLDDVIDSMFLRFAVFRLDFRQGVAYEGLKFALSLVGDRQRWQRLGGSLLGRIRIAFGSLPLALALHRVSN